MANISSMLRKISLNPMLFPPPAGEEISPTSFPLTKNIGVPLYEREDVVYKDFVVQVTAASFDKGNTKILNDSTASNSKKLIDRDVSFKKWKFNVIDGDGTVITARLDSTLHALGTNISAGAVIRVNSAFPVYFNYTDMTNMQCAIVIRDFSTIGRMPVPPECVGPPQDRLDVKSKTEEGKEYNSINTTEETLSKSNNEVQDISPEKCGGRFCSNHGIDFIACICKCVPLESISKERVARECVFATKDYKDMNNKNKRFLLYYFYATSVYQFHGKGNRVVLPHCLVSSIRKANPD